MRRDGNRWKAAALAPVLALACVLSALAANPLSDPVLEQRARNLSRELRCVVCQNQSIDDSDAPMAQDLRRIVREKIASGASDDEIKVWVSDRYGDFVLLSTPMKPHTLLLWAGAPIFLCLGLLGVFFYWKRRRREKATPDALTREEEERLNRILSGNGDRAP
ncbi:hypothetical protein FACS1894205_5080 [Alphaproteobacteria bacterium]|nr:hypothetical protein FACS1894205_5080 [Alphaproteobacteria bacterium]